MDTIGERLAQVKERLAAAARMAGRAPEEIVLLAVSKTQTAGRIAQARQAGQLHFGESYMQEARDKIASLGPGLRWHFIGHLQTNKARDAALLFDVVESIDQLKTAAALEKHLAQLGRDMDALVQVNVGVEAQKSGVSPSMLPVLLKEISAFTHLRIRGLMVIPPYSQDPEDSRPFFRKLRELSLQMQERKLLLPGIGGLELSMGMSHDFIVAIEEGATIVRVGTAIFGDRQ